MSSGTSVKCGTCLSMISHPYLYHVVLSEEKCEFSTRISHPYPCHVVLTQVSWGKLKIFRYQSAVLTIEVYILALLEGLREAVSWEPQACLEMKFLYL